jgi:2-polyprenyl-6-methoxyphenol hydroxylase-like FAD-dependent oxidoreductase
MKKHYQILIIGGGNAGISLAAQLLLKNAKLDIGIVEPSDRQGLKIQHEGKIVDDLSTTT